MYIQRAAHVFVYHGLKRLDFNKGWNVLGHLGVEDIYNEGWVDISWKVHVTDWSVYGLKCQCVEGSMCWSVYGLERLAIIAITIDNVCVFA